MEENHLVIAIRGTRYGFFRRNEALRPRSQGFFYAKGPFALDSNYGKRKPPTGLAFQGPGVDMDDFDERMMRRAMRLAERGVGRASPNPLVGAVLVKNGRIIGEGYHHEYGGAHAEAAAVAAAREDITGAVLYCNLEPCCYRSPEKHQPPCVELLVQRGIARVCVANRDPNPRVNGAGLRSLASAGIWTEEGLLADRGEELNEAFFHSMRTLTPFVHLKLVQSLDGRVATQTGESKWISDERARRAAHRLRVRSDAVLVGSGTVRADDPELTVRLSPGRDPLRVVLSSRLDIPPDAKLLRGEAPSGLVVFRAEGIDTAVLSRERSLARLGARVYAVPLGADGGLDLRAILSRLHDLKVRSLLVEGGSRILTSFVREGLYQKVSVITAPLFLGDGIPALGDIGLRALVEAPRLSRVAFRRIGDQILISGYRGGCDVHGHR